MNNAYSPKAFWYSKLREYRSCPARYKLKYIDGIVIEDKSLDTEFGTALNLGLDAVLLCEGDGVEIFEMYWEATRDDLTRFRYGWEDLAKMGPELLRKFREKEAKHYAPIIVGNRLYGTLGKHAYEGSPDFYGRYKGKLSIIDFKTSGKNYAPQKIISDEQMPGYAMLVEQNGYTPPEQTMYQVFKKDYKAPSLQNPLILPLTPEHHCNTLNNIRATCDEIAARKVFTANPDAYFIGDKVSPYFELVFGKGVKNEQRLDSSN